MGKNLLIISWRSLLKNKQSTFINLFGLFLGFSCFLVIFSYLKNEISYDKFHVNSDRIFRVTYNEQAGEIPGPRHLATVGPPLGPAMKENFTQVEDAVRFRYRPESIVQHGATQHYENKIFYVDPSIFKVFSFSLSSGDPNTALLRPNNVVLSPSASEKYFGAENPIGKTLRVGDLDVVVTGILDQPPSDSHISFDFLLPFEAFKVPYGYPVTLNDWGWISFHTYVMLKEATDAPSVEQQLNKLAVTHWSADRAKHFKLQLQPLEEIYLNDPAHEQIASGNKTYLFIMAGAGILLLLVSGFNFANLLMATSTSRAKEIGIRKVIGARRHMLSLQLIGESTLLSVFSALLAIALIPAITQSAVAVDFNVSFSGSHYLLVSGVLLGTSVVIGVLAGLYPSIALTSFNFQKLLKGSFKVGPVGGNIRKSLVFAQFAISLLLLASVFIISDQISYLKSKELGYAKDELMILRMPGDQLRARFPQLKNQLLQNSMISMVSVGGGRMDGDNGNVPIEGEGAAETVPMNIDAVTFDFYKTIGVNLLAGHEFHEQTAADTLSGVMINESAARVFGWKPEAAIGKRIRVGDIVTEGQVIGVLPDFHFGSLHNAIEPLVVYYPRTRLQDIYIRFSTPNVSSLIQSVQADWQSIVPDLPFDFVLLNEHLQGLYRSEKSFQGLFRIFGLLSVVIACLGLFGLVSQDVAFRVKEIGIRKVLGASVSSVMYLLLKQFLFLLILANIVAIPLCQYFMNQWLSEFTYHLSISWISYATAGALTIAAAFLTVSYKAAVAARANPAVSLRNE